MTEAGGSSPSAGPLDHLWEDEIPSTDDGFLRIGPPIRIDHGHEEDE